MIKLEIKNGNEPIPTVPETEETDLISDETLDRILADIHDGSYTQQRIDEGRY